MKAWPLKLRQMVISGRREERSFSELAEEFEVPLGTVKTWCFRDMKLRVKPTTVQAAVPDMKPDMKPAGPAMYRGLTAQDMPGRDRMQQSLNFAAMKRGQYPPRRWKVPGYLEGAALKAAMEAACGKFGKKKGASK